MKSRIFRYFLLSTLTILIVLTINTGCKKNSTETEGNDENLIGTWIMNEWTTNYSDGRTSTEHRSTYFYEILTFSSDGTYSFDQKTYAGPETGSGTWTTTGNEVKFVFSGQGGKHKIGIYSVSGNNLTITYEWLESTEIHRYTKEE